MKCLPPKGGSMRRIAFLLCMSAVLLGPASFGQDPSGEIPKILSSGFDSYKMGGPGEAIRTWLRGSPAEGSQDAMNQFAVLRSAQDVYGAYRGFEIVSARQISPSTRIVYMTLDYEKGPLFAKFVLYHSEQLGWIVTNLLFNTNETEVLPLQ
jgi:hypothetical protein